MSTPIFASRKAAKLAAELGVDPASITGTGRQGRVTAGDVRKAAQTDAHTGPSAPAGLGEAGRRLWTSITAPPDGAEIEFDSRELAILERAARQADDVARCEEIVARDGAEAVGSTGQTIVSPFLVEARQGRSTISRLLAALDLPTAEDADAADRSTAGRRLALQRWGSR